MKDIYELLNEIDIEEHEMDEMKVSEFEKKRVKTQFKKSINKKRRLKKSGIIAAAISLIIVGGTVTLGIANPTYAATIPIVGDIFRSLDNGRTGVYDKYKENADEINVTEESNGVSITIKDVIFDGQTLSYTYEIKSDRDLGENLDIYSGGPVLSIKDYNGSLSGGSGIKKVGENTYIGQDNETLDKEMDELNFKLNIRNIANLTDTSNIKTIEGNWNFDINVKAIASNKKIIDKSTEKEGIKATIDSITKTKMSFIINYSYVQPKELREKWLDSGLEIEIKDDLGNIYVGQGNGTSGNLDTGIFKCGKTYGILDENATKLIISPKMILTNNGGGVSIDENGNRTEIIPVIDENHPEKGQIIFDDIVVDLKK